MVNKLVVKHKDSSGSGKTNTENFYTTLNVGLSSDTAVAVDSWARGFVSLTSDTYEDVVISSTQSINEILVENS